MKVIEVIYDQQKEWGVRTSGKRVAKWCGSQHDAMLKAIQMAKNRKCELVIYRKDGTVRSRDTFTCEPFPPRSLKDEEL